MIYQLRVLDVRSIETELSYVTDLYNMAWGHSSIKSLYTLPRGLLLETEVDDRKCIYRIHRCFIMLPLRSVTATAEMYFTIRAIKYNNMACTILYCVRICYSYSTGPGIYGSKSIRIRGQSPRTRAIYVAINPWQPGYNYYISHLIGPQYSTRT